MVIALPSGNRRASGGQSASRQTPRGATALPSAVAKRIVLGLRAGGLEGGVGGMSPHVPRGATALPSAVAKRIVLGLRAGGLEGGVGGMSPHKITAAGMIAPCVPI